MKASREILRVKQVEEKNNEGKCLYYCNKLKFWNSFQIKR